MLIFYTIRVFFMSSKLLQRLHTSQVRLCYTGYVSSSVNGYVVHTICSSHHLTEMAFELVSSLWSCLFHSLHGIAKSIHILVIEKTYKSKFSPHFIRPFINI
jgi:hypothetical protein